MIFGQNWVNARREQEYMVSGGNPVSPSLLYKVGCYSRQVKVRIGVGSGYRGGLKHSIRPDRFLQLDEQLGC